VKRVLIINYGVGNIGSLINAFRKIGTEPVVTLEISDCKEIDAIVFPGVGSFDSAMRILKNRGIVNKINELVGNVPILGICLGMQLMFENSEEGIEKGLSWFKGKVERLRKGKIPHIGWSSIEIMRESPLLEGISNNSYFYFAHSYAVFNMDNHYIASKTECYGNYFVSTVSCEEKLIFGTQHHPEKSSKIGLKLLKNFINVTRK